MIEKTRLMLTQIVFNFFVCMFFFGLVPVCPHAGGVGLCEMVQHLQMWDYVSLSGSMDRRMIEFVDQQHEHFENPAVVLGSSYKCPESEGYSTKMTADTIEKFSYPHGTAWTNLKSSIPK